MKHDSWQGAPCDASTTTSAAPQPPIPNLPSKTGAKSGGHRSNYPPGGRKYPQVAVGVKVAKR
jgi:hypothetical protein